MSAEKDLKIYLRDKLLELPDVRQYSTTHLLKRCHVCGDSRKDPNKAHLYIKITPNDKERIVWYCVRCSAGGYVTPTLLREFEIHDLQLNANLIKFNKGCESLDRSIGTKENNFNFVIPKPIDDTLTEAKKKYIEDRLGIHFSIEELLGLKTIFDFGQFVIENKDTIQKLNVPNEKALLFQREYVGFLSTKNEFINFRNIINNPKERRWDKYSIYKNIDNTQRHYTIPNKIDLLSSKKLIVNMAEGVFDIFGVFYHLFNKNLHNSIYTAVCGCGFLSVLKYFISQGLVGEIEINIFSDADKDINFYKNIGVHKMLEWVDNINIYYNEKSKDYGIPKDQIKLIKKKL